MKAAETDTPVSELVSRAVRKALAEDAEDLGAIEKRAHEPARRFEDVLKALKRDGRL